MAGVKRQRRKQGIRVVLTDGRHTDDYFWLEHRGDGVYYGPSRNKSHFSYHADGKRHHSRGDGRDIFGDDDPLEAFRVQRILMTLPLSTRLPSTPRPYRAKHKGTAVFIDVRSLSPAGSAALVGLVEPGRLDAVQKIGEAHRPLYGSVRQMVVVTEVVPHVYVLVLSK